MSSSEELSAMLNGMLSQEYSKVEVKLVNFRGFYQAKLLVNGRTIGQGSRILTWVKPNTQPTGLIIETNEVHTEL